jgi:hypothetical protein
MLKGLFLAAVAGSLGFIVAPAPHQPCAHAQQKVYTYRWSLEAYYQGNCVARAGFTSTATSDQQEAMFIHNKLAGWAQELNARGIKWSRMEPRLISKD